MGKNDTHMDLEIGSSQKVGNDFQKMISVILRWTY